jgi:glycosyltransferase involved in cell wall biosynthesis
LAKNNSKKVIKKLKICFISAENSWHMSIWMKYFVEQGHEVHYIAVPSNIAYKIDFHAVTIHNLPSNRFNIKIFSGLEGMFERIIALRSIIRKIKPDIINAVDMGTGIYGALSGVHPFVMTPNGSDVILAPQRSKLAKFKNKFIFKFADAVTSDSEHCKKAAIACGAPVNNNYIVQWGVDFEKFNLNADRTIIRKKYVLRDDPVIFSPRGFTELYNIDTIIKSIPVVLSKKPNANFLFCYHFTKKEEELKGLASELGVDKSTIFVGYVANEKEMPYYTATADVCVSIPLSDSSPRAVYEAMACGVPLILSDLPWWKGMLKPEKNALIVDGKDHASLANAIIRLLDDEVLKKQMIENNYKFVSENMDNKKHAKKLESILESLINES